MADSLKDRLAEQLKVQATARPLEDIKTVGAPHNFSPIPSVDAIHGANTSILKKLTYLEIDPERCRPWKYHNRSRSWLNRDVQKSLEESIARDGQLELGLVRTIEGDPKFNHEIIYGFRRSEACKTKGIKFKARVLPATTPDKVCVQYMHVENKESHDVSDLEEARNYKALVLDGVYANQSALAESLSVDQSRVSQLVKAAELFDYEWMAELLEPIIYDVSIRAATAIARALSDPNQLRNVRNHVRRIKEQGIAVKGDELQNLLLTEKKAKAGPKMVKTVLVKKGRNNLVELQSDDSGNLLLSVKAYARNEDERRALLEQIMVQLGEKL